MWNVKDFYHGINIRSLQQNNMLKSTTNLDSWHSGPKENYSAKKKNLIDRVKKLKLKANFTTLVKNLEN